MRTPTTAMSRINFSTGPVSALATAMMSEMAIKAITRSIAKGAPKQATSIVPLTQSRKAHDRRSLRDGRSSAPRPTAAQGPRSI